MEPEQPLVPFFSGANLDKDKLLTGTGTSQAIASLHAKSFSQKESLRCKGPRDAGQMKQNRRVARFVCLSCLFYLFSSPFPWILQYVVVSLSSSKAMFTFFSLTSIVLINFGGAGRSQRLKIRVSMISFPHSTHHLVCLYRAKKVQLVPTEGGVLA